MRVEISTTATRLEIAAKILNWNKKDTTGIRVAKELNVKIDQLFKMNEEDFFDTIYYYVHKLDYFKLV